MLRYIIDEFHASGLWYCTKFCRGKGKCLTWRKRMMIANGAAKGKFQCLYGWSIEDDKTILIHVPLAIPQKLHNRIKATINTLWHKTKMHVGGRRICSQGLRIRIYRIKCLEISYVSTQIDGHLSLPTGVYSYGVMQLLIVAARWKI